MRSFIAGAFQFVLFLATFFLGSFVLHPFGLRTMLRSDDLHTRMFLWDGLLLLGVLYVLVLVLEAVTKRLRGRALRSTVAAALAAAAGLAMKFGFVTVDR